MRTLNQAVHYEYIDNYTLVIENDPEFSHYIINCDWYSVAVYEGRLAEDACLDSVDPIEAMPGFCILELAIESGIDIINACDQKFA